MAGQALRMTVPCDRHAPKAVRQALEALPALEPVREDVLLVASELVSNAVLHSACPEGELLTVCASCSEARMRIAVVDPGLSGGQAEVIERPPASGGLGLRVVQEISESWGAERRQEGYRVWAEVPLAA